ncbi:MAG: RDD family protein [Planctomycetota bacterium]|nr:RDD family protein [Planctomycetota bacterium]
MSTRSPNLLRPERGREEVLTTPEGVPLPFTIALAGDRLGAFVLDWILSKLIIVALLILASLVDRGEQDAGWILTVVIIVSFLVEQFYFIWFEVRRRGMTPGKQRAGIRVVSRHAGPITPEAIVARNLTRVLEVQVPLTVLLFPEAMWPDAPGWVQLVAMTWILVFAGMPLWNRQRLRIGDMVAGTMVVLTPKTLLLEDLGGKTQKRTEKEGRRFVFTPEQLAVYGIYELQVLEDLLRQSRVGATRDAMVAVTRKICRKIGYDQSVKRADVERFLTEFYAAMRAHQEHRLLFGRRKRDKHSTEESM